MKRILSREQEVWDGLLGPGSPLAWLWLSPLIQYLTAVSRGSTPGSLQLLQQRDTRNSPESWGVEFGEKTQSCLPHLSSNRVAPVNSGRQRWHITLQVSRKQRWDLPGSISICEESLGFPGSCKCPVWSTLMWCGRGTPVYHWRFGARFHCCALFGFGTIIPNLFKKVLHLYPDSIICH